MTIQIDCITAPAPAAVNAKNIFYSFLSSSLGMHLSEKQFNAMNK
ncbi:hypothetical protein [Paraglaciecola sp. L3A3]|nr:hypothetical protein [Paraglaciecola sp. L3A3]